MDEELVAWAEVIDELGLRPDALQEGGGVLYGKA